MMSVASNDWPSTSKGYKLMNSIGSGYFGTVWKAEILEGKHTKEHVAIKRIELEKCADNKIAEIRKSMLLANLLNHPNILSYKIAFITKQELWLVSELMCGGSVDKIIQAKFPNGIKDQVLIATIMKEALKGLRYLHQNNQIHRDVKGANILIGLDGLIKISDFGVAAKVKEGEKRKTFIGSPCWMAPEVLNQDDKMGYDFKADIWSLGITALEIAHGQPPNSDLNTMKLILKTLNEEPPKLNDESCWDDSFREFIKYCLVKDPASRKSADDLLRICKTFLGKAKGPEYIKEKLLKGCNTDNNTNKTPDTNTLTTNCFYRKSCTINFDFSVEQEETEASQDLQMKLDHCHLTKKESDFMLQQSIQNCLLSRKVSQEPEPRLQQSQIHIEKTSCSAATRLLRKQKSEKAPCSKGDYANDFGFLNEEEI